MPRPCTFTPRLGDTLTRAVEAGLSERAACRVAGVPARTFRRWVAHGRKAGEADSPLAVFARKLAAVRMLGRLCSDDHGPGRGLEQLARQVDRLAERVAELTAGRV